MLFRSILVGLGLLVALAAGYVLAWPTRIEPVEVNVGPNPGFTGVFARNERLRAARWLGEGVGLGPEDITVKDGYAYTGLEDGRVVRIRIDGQTASGPAPLPVPLPGAPAPEPVPMVAVETVATTGGRPLGLQHDPFGNIVVADAKKGLVAITAQGQVVTVADKYQGRPLRFVDDLDIARDGTIYFSNASQRFGIDEYKIGRAHV